MRMHHSIEYFLSAPTLTCKSLYHYYKSGTVNSKSFVGKVFLRNKWKFELNKEDAIEF